MGKVIVRKVVRSGVVVLAIVAISLCWGEYRSGYHAQAIIAGIGVSITALGVFYQLSAD